MKTRAIISLLFSVLLTACTGGYSFTGASIPPEAKTISVATFPNYAATVNPQLSQKLTDDLIQMFSSQTSLDIASDEGDLQLSGEATATTPPHRISQPLRAPLWERLSPNYARTYSTRPW